MTANEHPLLDPGPGANAEPLVEAVPATNQGLPLEVDAPPPAVDPWSRRAAGPAPPESGDTPSSPPSRPYGWEWSRSASPSAAVVSTGMVIAAPPSLPAPLRANGSPSNRLGLDLLALSMALLGGLLAIIGAFFQELQSGVGVFLLVLAAPVIEEVLKPAGIYVLLVKWPQALRGHLHTAALCAVSGMVFGIVESLVYVKLYYPDGSDAFVLFRFTVTPLMHAVASFIVGYGLTHGLLDWANGRSSLPKRTRTCFLLGIGLHATYNTAVVFLGLLGVLDFLETTVIG